MNLPWSPLWPEEITAQPPYRFQILHLNIKVKVNVKVSVKVNVKVNVKVSVKVNVKVNVSNSIIPDRF